MKKLLNLFSVLTISGSAVPTTIAASPYQKEEKLIKDINYLKTNNLEILNRNKRDFYEKEKIEFFNNNFFYKFNINYSGEKSTNGAWDSQLSSVTAYDSITLIKDWSKYANSWEEFSKKFPEIELVNFKTVIDGKEKIIEKFKINNTKIQNKKWSEQDILNFFSNNYNYYNFKWKTSVNEVELENKISELRDYRYKSFVCDKSGKIIIRLYVDKQELKAQIIYKLYTSNCTSPYKGSLKFDSIRLVGDIDVNPLFSLTVEKAKYFDIWANNRWETLKLKRENKNYDQNILKNEEEDFKNEFKLLLLQIKHDYIQDLINIDQDNEKISIRSEIDKIKSRLHKLEKRNTCLDNIFDAFKKNAFSDAPGDAWKSIKDNSESPLKIIVKKSGEAFATGLLTGVAKGSALGIISCIADSII